MGWPAAMDVDNKAPAAGAAGEATDAAGSASGSKEAVSAGSAGPAGKKAGEPEPSVYRHDPIARLTGHAGCIPASMQAAVRLKLDCRLAELQMHMTHPDGHVTPSEQHLAGLPCSRS